MCVTPWAWAMTSGDGPPRAASAPLGAAQRASSTGRPEGEHASAQHELPGNKPQAWGDHGH